MIRVIVSILVLSLAAVALGAPQHHGLHGLHGPHASKATTFSSGAAATEGVAATLHGRANTYPDRRSVGLPGFTTEARLAPPAGRAPWSHDAHRNGETQTGDHILEQQYDMQPSGTYVYSYKTSNGIAAEARGALKSGDAEVVQGAYEWVAPNGEMFAVEYIADETGFHAQGAHIPQIPVAIERSLEWNAAHPEEEEGQEGQEGEAGWQGSERASSGRAAWVSESSANVPAWESSAKIETGRIGSAAGRSAWNTAIPASTGAGSTIKTTTYAEGSTLRKPAITTYSTSGLAPAARAAWASDATATGFTGTGATQITKITKITETKPAFATYTTPGLAPAAPLA